MNNRKKIDEIIAKDAVSAATFQIIVKNSLIIIFENVVRMIKLALLILLRREEIFS